MCGTQVEELGMPMKHSCHDLLVEVTGVKGRMGERRVTTMLTGCSLWAYLLHWGKRRK